PRGRSAAPSPPAASGSTTTMPSTSTNGSSRAPGSSCSPRTRPAWARFPTSAPEGRGSAPFLFLGRVVIRAVAPAALGGVVVEMVLMEGVASGAEGGAEDPAGIPVHPAEQIAAPLAPPAIQHRDRAAVRPFEAGNVDRHPAAVFRDPAFLAVIDAATDI